MNDTANPPCVVRSPLLVLPKRRFFHGVPLARHVSDHDTKHDEEKAAEATDDDFGGEIEANQIQRRVLERGVQPHPQVGVEDEEEDDVQCEVGDAEEDKHSHDPVLVPPLAATGRG